MHTHVHTGKTKYHSTCSQTKNIVGYIEIANKCGYKQQAITNIFKGITCPLSITTGKKLGNTNVNLSG